MKKIKTFMVGTICFAMLFIITGCGNKKAITLLEFKTSMEDKGYIIQDATSQLAQYDYITKVYLAMNSDSTYQIEFYEISDNGNAIVLYNSIKTLFEKSKSSGSVETSVNVGNHEKYTLITNGKYKVVSRIDNTIIYADASDEYKNVIKNILEDLKY